MSEGNAASGQIRRSNPVLFYDGLYLDRAWGPERPVFGKVRYMSSESTARKLRVKEFIRRHAP